MGQTDARDPWWEQGEFRTLQEQAATLRKAGDYIRLASVYENAEQYAAEVGHIQARISYLTALGNVYLFLYRYREAIETYRKAIELAEQSGDWEGAGAIAPGLASVYLMVGDTAAARLISEDGLRFVSRLSHRPYYEANLKLQYARLSSGSGDPRPALETIEAARAQGPVAEGASRVSDQFEIESEAWSILGEERLRSGDLEGAEAALAEGFRIRRLLAPRGIFSSYRLLGALRLEQAVRHPERRQKLLADAERFTELSLEAASQGEGSLTVFRALAQRGAILQMQGRTEEALRDFAAAAEFVSRWRLTLPAADSVLTAANIGLDENVFRSYAEAAAARALETGEERWLQQSFVAAEQNRAISLRQAQELVPVWRERLPDRYWAALEEIRKTESAGLVGEGVMSRSERLHLELAEMESKFGVSSLTNGENFDGRSALIQLQKVLSKNNLLLSIQVGQKCSYLWSVTQNTLHLYRLPGREEISQEVVRFRRSVLEGRSDANTVGAKLYRILFGQLSALEVSKASWLLSLDGPLFELPFAALWDDLSAPEPAFLIERHALQIIPGAFLLGKKLSEAASMDQGQVTEANKHGGPAGKKVFAGFGDAVYNTADPRFDWGPSGWLRRWAGPRIGGQLNRLLASGDEVTRSAEAWQTGTATGVEALVFTGRAARRDVFLSTLERRLPSVIHLATHVLTANTIKSQAFLAFSAAPGGGPELLATSDVARLSVPGALVVMTGCSSGTGDIVAGAGILGLTRAWLVAGASAVVATGWAVEDSRGDLMPAFYSRLHQDSPAEALRQSQVAMIHSGNWQANPAYWASYQLTGVTR